MKATCKQINFQQQTFLETSSEIEYTLKFHKALAFLKPNAFAS